MCLVDTVRPQTQASGITFPRIHNNASWTALAELKLTAGAHLALIAHPNESAPLFKAKSALMIKSALPFGL